VTRRCVLLAGVLILVAGCLVGCGGGNPATDGDEEWEETTTDGDGVETVDDQEETPDENTTEAGEDDLSEQTDDELVDESADGGDGTEEEASESACLTSMDADRTLTLAPLGTPSQFHPAAAAGHGGVWVVYNGFTPSTKVTGYDVYALHLHCNGAQRIAPFQVNTTTGVMHVDPDVAVSGDNVLFAWASDNGLGGSNNLSIYYRMYDRDGQALMDTDARLPLVRGGATLDTNAWMVKATPLPGGKFVLAGSYGSEEAGRFQVFMQYLAADGTPDGEIVPVYPEVGQGQVDPAVAADDSGTVYLAYTRNETQEEVFHTRFAPDSLTPDPDPPQLVVAGKTGAAPSLASYPGPEKSVVVAWQRLSGDASTVYVKDAALFNPAALPLGLGASGMLNHSPAAAVAVNHGAVMWLQVISGVRNQVYVQGFDKANSRLSLSDEALLLSIGPAAPYVPDLTLVEGHCYFGVWAQGASPNFQATGRYICFP